MEDAQVRRSVDAQAKEAAMNHDETIALAEHHRATLLADAAGTRRRRQARDNLRKKFRRRA
jgi:hypothetical protein